MILLIRDPVDTLIAEWNRRNTNSHTGIVSEKVFSNKVKWNDYVKKQSKIWEDFYMYYVDNYQLDQLHVLRYEKLKDNLGLEMKHVIEFLGLEFEKSVESCVKQKQVGSFKRPKSNVYFKKFFSATQKSNIEMIRRKVYAKLDILS